MDSITNESASNIQQIKYIFNFLQSTLYSLQDSGTVKKLFKTWIQRPKLMSLMSNSY